MEFEHDPSVAIRLHPGLREHSLLRSGQSVVFRLRNWRERGRLCQSSSRRASVNALPIPSEIHWHQCWLQRSGDNASNPRRGRQAGYGSCETRPFEKGEGGQGRRFHALRSGACSKHVGNGRRNIPAGRGRQPRRFASIRWNRISGGFGEFQSSNLAPRRQITRAPKNKCRGLGRSGKCGRGIFRGIAGRALRSQFQGHGHVRSRRRCRRWTLIREERPVTERRNSNFRLRKRGALDGNGKKCPIPARIS